jgi:hypothetical protein
MKYPLTLGGFSGHTLIKQIYVDDEGDIFFIGKTSDDLLTGSGSYKAFAGYLDF